MEAAEGVGPDCSLRDLWDEESLSLPASPHSPFSLSLLHLSFPLPGTPRWQAPFESHQQCHSVCEPLGPQ